MTSEHVEQNREGDWRWDNKDIKEAPEDVRPLFEKYAKIPPQDIVPHILDIRSKGFQIHPYPCIGQYRFLILTLKHHPAYSEILRRVTEGEVFLDLGTCFGQDLRQLVFDGAPSTQTFGVDIERTLVDLGFDLFKDRETLSTNFIFGDVFDQQADWSKLQGKADIVHASAFFHLFSREQQVQVACLLVGWMRPRPGALIVGRQVGDTKPGEFRWDNMGEPKYRHNVETLQIMWNEIGAKTGTSWIVDGSMDKVGFQEDMLSAATERQSNGEIRRLLFSIRRI